MSKLLSHKYFLRFAIFISAVLITATIFLIWGFSFQKVSGAGTNISSTDRWAWNDVTGWIDFYSTNSVLVSSTDVTGYATSSIGQLYLDCASSPSCGAYTYKVLKDGIGNLSGQAWNDLIGWVTFCTGSGSPDCPGSISSGVDIDIGNGDFSGWAWNDVVGWISFNCQNHGCPPDYKVNTIWLSTPSIGWLESATFDTGVPGGAQINSITWRGNAPAGTAVKFQLAFSSSSVGPWTFGWQDFGNSSTSPSILPYVPASVNLILGTNQRYFRYRAYLFSDLSHTETPRIDDVIVNWSR